MPDLTPELLDKVEALAKAATPGPWSTEPPTSDTDGWSLGVKIGATRGGSIYAMPQGGQYPAADARHIAAASPDVVLQLVAAARERDALKEAARLREAATLEAWSGSASGLSEAERLNGQALALESLAGIERPTAEQQRDAAFAKLATQTAKLLGMQAEVATALRRGFDIAVEHAEVSTWDGWHVTDPRIDWSSAEKMIRAEIERKP